MCLLEEIQVVFFKDSVLEEEEKKKEIMSPINKWGQSASPQYCYINIRGETKERMKLLEESLADKSKLVSVGFMFDWEGCGGHAIAILCDFVITTVADK